MFFSRLFGVLPTLSFFPRRAKLHVQVAVLATAALFFWTASVRVQPAFAQETTGGIQGSIKDSTGAVVPQATVTATAP